MSDSEFFDGADNGDGLPMTYTVPAEEAKNISELHKMVTVEIDRSRTRSNHLNKMMRQLMQRQQEVQKQTTESYKMLNAELEKAEGNYLFSTPSPDATPPHSPIVDSSGRKNSSSENSSASSAGGDASTSPDPIIKDNSSTIDSDASTPPDPAFTNSSRASEPDADSAPPDQPDDEPELKILPDRVVSALRARGIPDDLKVKFEMHPVHGPHLSVTRSKRLEGRAEHRVQEIIFKLTNGFSAIIGWSQPLSYTETFTESSKGSYECDCLIYTHSHHIHT